MLIIKYFSINKTTKFCEMRGKWTEKCIITLTGNLKQEKKNWSGERKNWLNVIPLSSELDQEKREEANFHTKDTHFRNILTCILTL